MGRRTHPATARLLYGFCCSASRHGALVRMDYIEAHRLPLYELTPFERCGRRANRVEAGLGSAAAGKGAMCNPLGPGSSAQPSRYGCLGGAVRPDEFAAFALIDFDFTLSLSIFTHSLSTFD